MKFWHFVMWGLSLQRYIDPPGGGGGAPDPKVDPAPDPAAELAALKAELAALKAKAPTPPADDPDLQEKARKARESSDKDASRTKSLENALKFSLRSSEFLKQNEALLPKEVADIFKQADKENYSDAIEKDGAIKAGLVQSFFSVQANVDLLTAGQKSSLDDYLKLTKTGKQEKAQAIYDMIFEPAFEMLKRVKKAEALTRGHAAGTDVEDNYRKRLLAHSRKHYLGEKTDA